MPLAGKAGKAGLRRDPRARRPAITELTGRGVPGGDVDVGLVGRLASILPSPVLESDGKLDGAIDHRIIVCTLCRDVPTGIRSGESLCADLRSRLAACQDPAVAPA